MVTSSTRLGLKGKVFYDFLFPLSSAPGIPVPQLPSQHPDQHRQPRPLPAALAQGLAASGR